MSWILGAAKILLLVQAPDPSLLGTIRDGVSDEPLAGAVITLPDIGWSVVSDVHGRYAFPAAPPGPQHVTVRCIGYAPRTLHALIPREGDLEINLTLQPDPFRLPAIEVRSAVAMRGVESGDSTAFPDRGISLAAVRNHPLLAEPDAFLALSGGEVALSPESPSGIHVRGGASDQTAYLLDGVPIFSPYHAGGTFSAWNPDALEQLQLSSSAPSPAFPEALSATVAGETRTPGSRVSAQGSVSTTQARATVDGPVGLGGAGYLLSFRSGLPRIGAPRADASYLRTQMGDVLAKLEVPAVGGRVRLLGYDSENEIDAAANLGGADGVPPDPTRNAFEWRSRSLGAEWARPVGSLGVRLQGWYASANETASWNVEAGAPIDMAARRQDEGFVAMAQRKAAGDGGTTIAGLRIRRSRTSYRVTPVGEGAPALSFDVRTPVAAIFAQHQRAIGRRVRADLALSTAGALGDIYLEPRAQFRWIPSHVLTLSGSYVRSHQFSQSLRNPESVVGNVFPADVYVGAGASGIPVARSNQGVLAAEYHPSAGIRLGTQMYLRDFDGLLLVAPRTGEPFATSAFATGSGMSRGLSLDAAVSTARYGLVASYGWQRVRLQYGDSSYAPTYGTAHLIEAGVIVFPSATSSIRFGATGGIGRRATALAGAFEWEACNLLDKGCEFGGSPDYSTAQLGATRLPSYLRLDLSVRKHWHLELGGRDVQVALFGTITNVIGRKNVLTIAPDPVTGRPTQIEMRPRAPLVLGLDWQF